MDGCYYHLRRLQEQQADSSAPRVMVSNACVLRLVSEQQLLDHANVQLLALGDGDAADEDGSIHGRQFAKLRGLGVGQVRYMWH